MIYFVQGNQIRSEFGFPRTTEKKCYRWYFPSNPRKKMNFATNLPKRSPLVTYIVASAMKCSKFKLHELKQDNFIYRMHAVTFHAQFRKFLRDNNVEYPNNLIVCHLRKVSRFQDVLAEGRKAWPTPNKFRPLPNLLLRLRFKQVKVLHQDVPRFNGAYQEQLQLKIDNQIDQRRGDS